MKVAPAQVNEAAAHSHSPEVAKEGLLGWIGWASRSRLQPVKHLA